MSHAAVISKQRSIKRYGWIPQLPDHRDIHYKVTAPQPLPDVVDLRPRFASVPPYNQFTLGSCTANAIGGAYEYDLILQGCDPYTPSRLFIYYNERLIEKSVTVDSGAMIRDGMKAINVAGAPPETLWPYKVKSFADKPPVSVYREGRKHRSLQYEALPQSDYALRSVLAHDNLPFVFGFTVFDAFEGSEVEKTGIVPMPPKDAADLGGHAVLAVGYITINDTKYFIVRNSWGVKWGDKGYFYLPAEYVLNPDLASDFWVLRTVQSDK